MHFPGVYGFSKGQAGIALAPSKFLESNSPLLSSHTNVICCEQSELEQLSADLSPLLRQLLREGKEARCRLGGERGIPSSPSCNPRWTVCRNIFLLARLDRPPDDPLDSTLPAWPSFWFRLPAHLHGSHQLPSRCL